ncbi:helix-turn-helix domain-containing protein [Candidatus Odyssella thessalonicensis]|uniref:helix-turn-helix domain-containing protein n=1 Tax=Candidatus Odyssella thessalonicensis TaxID=84647 RepID=UPI000225AC25|nr:helix-turn-helix transcriptional regulator [Candidatus Odyssella thessalonicensis]
MAIIINLDVMLAKRKKKLQDLAAVVGITVQNLSILKTGRAKAIRFSTLESICHYLQCQPGDLLEWQPEEDGAKSDEELQGSADNNINMGA